MKGKLVKCSHCGEIRWQRVKGSRCGCGYKPVSLFYKLLRAVRGLKQKPYKARNKDAKILLAEIRKIAQE